MPTAAGSTLQKQSVHRLMLTGCLSEWAGQGRQWIRANVNDPSETKRAGVNRLQSEARKLAFYLFWNIKGDIGRNHVLLEDLEQFLQPELAEQAFAMLDRDGNGQVTLHVRSVISCPASTPGSPGTVCVWSGLSQA